MPVTATPRTATPTGTPSATPAVTQSPTVTGTPGAAGANALANPSFDLAGTPNWHSPWAFAVAGTARGTVARDTGQIGPFSARVDITATDVSSPWNLQFYQVNLPVTAGSPVTISFLAKASKGRPIGVAASGSSFYMPNVNLSTAWQQYSFTFTPSVSGTAALAFNFGAADGSVWLDAVSFSASSP